MQSETGAALSGQEGFPMNKHALSRAAAAAAVLALAAAPAALAARPDNPGSQGQGHGKGAAKGVAYVFKGTYTGAGSVDVDHGNAHARKAGLVGGSVSFDLSAAKLVVADTVPDGVLTADDVAVGDRVVVKARLPRTDPGVQPYAARQLVDQTSPPVDSTDAD
jgi:hypothetical protein